jgi:hypothetical protein
MYHATMPTDALTRLRDTMQETAGLRLRQGEAEQEDLGRKVRALFESRGLPASPPRASRRPASW